jgi:hypothetical protein
MSVSDQQLGEQVLKIHRLAVSTSFISTKDGQELRGLLGQLLLDLGVYFGANPPMILYLAMPPRDSHGRFVKLCGEKK